MITIQHSAVYLLTAGKLDSAKFGKNIPWLLLPDAIRMYVGPRQASHFEEKPDETDVSWMRFPNAESLKKLSRENVKELVSFYVVPNIPRCVIGEQTNLEEFDRYNYAHPQYHMLRAHLVQDCVLDQVLRKFLIDPTRRFEDRFEVRHNRSIVLDGTELRKQVGLFEHLGFLHLAGKVYEKTGILINQKWFDMNVYPALLEAYPHELADNTYYFMIIPQWVEERMNQLDFSMPEEYVQQITMVKDADTLVGILDRMYAAAMYHTWREIVAP